MDFKVCGTAKGITAIQMDIKIAGLSREILTKALDQAREGRLHILGKMLETLSTPRAELSQVRAAHHDPQGEAGPDPPHHRPGRQDDQGHHRSDRRRHRRRGRRHGQRRVERQRRREEGDRHHQGPHGGARGRRDLQGHRQAHHATSARSSRSCRAPTASSTSPRWRTRASSEGRATSSRRATSIEVKVISVGPRRQDPPLAPRARSLPRGRRGRARQGAHAASPRRRRPPAASRRPWWRTRRPPWPAARSLSSRSAVASCSCVRLTAHADVFVRGLRPRAPVISFGALRPACGARRSASAALARWRAASTRSRIRRRASRRTRPRGSSSAGRR